MAKGELQNNLLESAINDDQKAAAIAFILAEMLFPDIDVPQDVIDDLYEKFNGNEIGTGILNELFSK